MAKWSRPDPDAAWKAIVAQLLPEIKAQTDALIASWNAPYPADYSKQISRIVRPIIASHYPDSNQDARIAGDMLIDQLAKPIISLIAKQKRDAERAAEALVLTDRPVVAHTFGHDRERIGSLGIVTSRTKASQVLTCIASAYDRGDGEDRNAGWYSNYAEPTEEERLTPEYAALTAKIAADAAEAERVGKMMRAISAADQAGATERSSDPQTKSLLDDLWGE